MKNKIIFALAVVLVILSLIVLSVILKETNNAQIIKFNSGDETLVASYYPVANSEKAILLCGGFSSDQAMLRPLANLAVSSGLSAMTFDYVGHGKSSGAIGFDNATNGQTVREIKLAIEKLKSLTALEDEDIILLGHSMGARALLELLVTSSYPAEYEQVILLSPQINYDNNTQSSTFTGVNDSVIAPWKDLDGKLLNNTKITLIGSTADDIVSPFSANEIYERIKQDNDVSLSLVDGVYHSYMVYSVAVASEIKEHCSYFTDDVSSLRIMYLSWFAIIIGLILALLSLEKLLSTNAEVLHLVNFKKFIIFKLILWLPSLVVMAIIAVISVLMPFGSPIMSIIFIGGIAGYGVSSLIVYKKGKMRGVAVLPKTLKKEKLKGRNIALSIVIFLSVLYVFVLGLSSGLYNLFPLNFRMFWLLVASAAMSVGFYISSQEGLMLKTSKVSMVVIYNIVQYVLLALMAIAYLALESYSGLIGLIQNLFLLYISIFAGNCISRLTNTLYGSIASAILFQCSMMTATCLMVVF